VEHISRAKVKEIGSHEMAVQKLGSRRKTRANGAPHLCCPLMAYSGGGRVKGGGHREGGSDVTCGNPGGSSARLGLKTTHDHYILLSCHLRTSDNVCGFSLDFKSY
jgi:hypothetical protein